MSDFAERIDRLTPEKRELLLSRLRSVTGVPSDDLRIPRRSASPSAPLSFAQRRLWFLDQLSHEQGGYQIVGAICLEGVLNEKALQESLEAIVLRHEVLRSTIQMKDGEPTQVVAANTACPLERIDLKRFNPELQKTWIRQFLNDEQHRRFDLEHGLLLRATLLELPDHKWIFVVAMHHIVADGWSIGIFCRELSEFYRTFCTGEPSQLSALPIQYADFSEWQRTWLQGDVLQRQLAFWRERLNDLPTLNLSGHSGRSLASGGPGGLQERWIADSMRNELHEFNRRENVTLYMTLLAAFQLLLARYTGQLDIVVGTPVANRNRRDLELLIGFFVNTLVMRTNLSGDPSFLQLLNRVRETAISAFAHQDLPFERLVEELQPQRYADRNPLFQVAFAVQNAPQERLEMAGLSLTPLELEVTTSRFDLELHVWEQKSGLRLVAIYDRARFDTEMVAGLLRHFETLIGSVLVNPRTCIWELPLIPDTERQQLLSEWNSESHCFPSEAGLFELFREQVAQTPEAVAVLDDKERLTYRELDIRSRQIAKLLHQNGIRLESPVALALEPSCGSIAATLGVVRAGGVYIPLDSHAPPARWTQILNDTMTHVVLTQRSFRERIPARANLRVIEIEEIDDSSLPDDSNIPSVSVCGDNLAYVMYTSGSTGQPKGISVQHRAIVRLVRNSTYLQICPDDVVAQISNQAFDAATFEIWGALLNGARLVILPKESIILADTLGRLIERHRISVVFLTTSLFNHLARQNPGVFSPLRCLLFGGEAADPETVRTVLADEEPGWLLHVYGPTENTTFSTFHVVRKLPREVSSIPIGRPLSGTEIYVLDDRMNPVPIGIPGQLYIGGQGLARGYVANSRLTADRFRPHPFSGHPGQRLYATGDLVRFQRDGAVEFLGRRDHQVKLRGFRIELGEIESLLRGHPAVQDAVVLVESGGPQDRRLVACLQARKSSPIAAEEILRDLRAQLPSYMIPASIVWLAEFPLNAHGKIDRENLSSRLPARSAAGSQNSEFPVIQPRTLLEEAIVEIFSELLELEYVPLRESFFDLGGHSLLATQLASRLRDVFQIELPLSTLFRAPAVATLSDEIARLLRDEEADESPPLVPMVRGPGTTASSAQQRLWFLHRFQPGWGGWHIPWLVELRGPVDIVSLQNAIDLIVVRHEALRTRFAEVDGRPVQIVADSAHCHIRTVDLRDVTEAERQEAVRRLAADEQRDPFDLGTAPLMRSCLLHLEDEYFIFGITLHHIVCDGWSLGILGRELSTGYDAFRRGLRPDLPELVIQYADYSEWQRQRLSSLVLSRQLKFWCQNLANLPQLQLPTDFARPTRPVEAGSTVIRQFSNDLTRRIRALNRQEGTTLYMTLLSAFSLLLSRFTGQVDIAVGTPIANRNRSEVEGLIGLFVNSMVMRIDLSGNPSFCELLCRVRAAAISAYTHQDVPFEKIVEELKPERHLSRHPLFQVVFAVQNASRETMRLTDIDVRPLEFEVATTRYDLQLDVWEHADSLQLNAFYRRDLFESETIRQWLYQLENLLSEIVASPTSRLSEYLLLPDDHVRWLAARNTPVSFDDAAQCLHHRFVARAQKSPDAVAVVSGDQQLTYGELDRFSNRIANRLRQHGVQEETRVGLFVDRSPALIAGMLGILKAGGAYVPLEPNWPDQRVAGVLTEANATVVLTQLSLLSRITSFKFRTEGSEGRPTIILMDSHETDIASDAPMPNIMCSDNLAYVMFTSGSSGLPKGVLITHANVDRLLSAVADKFQFDERDVWTLFHSFAFDFSVWEIWGALLNGGRLIVVPFLISRSPAEFCQLLKQHGVTILNQTPAAFSQLSEVAGPADLPLLRCVIFGGESLDTGSLRRWQDNKSGRPRLINMYGITETTVHVTFRSLETVSTATGKGSLIGVPLPGVRIFLLDEAGNQVPVGCPGEICVGGEGLARGYLADPALTAEKFIPDSFSGLPGQRLYRSGDLARYRSDGCLEFLGRRDSQVKIRGFRVELGEIEAVLRSSDFVREAVVIYRQEVPGAERLVAYVIAESTSDEVQRQQAAEKHRLVSNWRILYDEVYRDSVPTPNPEFNITGWNCSYTGLPLGNVVMQEQVGQTVDRILALRPQRILEIGCGTGLLLYRLAANCGEYVGTEISPVALEGLRDRLPENVTLLLREANDFSEIQPGSLDMVVLNSVIQYFPDTDYLRRVLISAARVVCQGGSIFVGDVRSLSLWPAFHTSVELFRAADATTLAEFRERVRQQMNQERELLIDPGFFSELRDQLPGLREICVEPKRGQSRNELTQFRYDVTMHFGTASSPPEITEWLNWRENSWSVADIRRRLQNSTTAAWGLLAVDNARVRDAVSAVMLLDELADELTVLEARSQLLQHTSQSPAIDPEQLWALGEDLPVRVIIRWTGGRPRGDFDVAFLPRTDDTSQRWPVFPAVSELSQSSVSAGNAPWQPQFASALARELRAELQQQLPEYMVPGMIVVQESFPLTSSGKVDRYALSLMDNWQPLRDETCTEPRNVLESTLAKIWCEVLRVRKPGIHDNFFDLGGHSLLATQVVARIRDVCRQELPLRILFESPTIAELAAALDALNTNRTAKEHPADRDSPVGRQALE